MAKSTKNAACTSKPKSLHKFIKLLLFYTLWASTHTTTALADNLQQQGTAVSFGANFRSIAIGTTYWYTNQTQGKVTTYSVAFNLRGSDITRTYVFGTPSERVRAVWEDEKAAQLQAFAAAQLGAPCGAVDNAARAYLNERGYGPDYRLPGLPHRTGHGIGLDIHEWPYLVASDNTPLAVGMCFSNEPMICVPGEFGIRLEDHFYLSDNDLVWFTQPAHTLDAPFAYEG